MTRRSEVMASLVAHGYDILWGQPAPSSAYHAYEHGRTVCGVLRPLPETFIRDVPKGTRCCLTCRFKLSRRIRSEQRDVIRRAEYERMVARAKERDRNDKGHYLATSTPKLSKPRKYSRAVLLPVTTDPRKKPYRPDPDDLSSAQIDAILEGIDARRKAARAVTSSEAWRRPA